MALVVLVLLLVFAVVLSANGGRNLTILLKTLDLPLPQFIASVTPAPPVIDIAPVATGRWPWLKGISHHPAPPISMLAPEDMCRSLAVEGQEAPSFVKSGADGWECSMLFATSSDPAGDSLFLQARGGEDGQFTIARVKFNLAGGRLPDDLSRRSLAFLRAAMKLPPSENLDEDFSAKLASQADFYFIAGYHALTFRREVDNPGRYNLIGFNRRIAGAEPWIAWPRAGIVAEDAPVRAPKGPRLSAQSGGSP